LITLDRYGHLFPGSEKEAAGLLDTYLERSIGGAPREGALHVRCTNRACSGVDRGRLGPTNEAKPNAKGLQITNFSGGGGIRTLGGP
jgi:hypothetical protein